MKRTFVREFAFVAVIFLSLFINAQHVFGQDSAQGDQGGTGEGDPFMPGGAFNSSVNFAGSANEMNGLGQQYCSTWLLFS